MAMIPGARYWPTDMGDQLPPLDPTISAREYLWLAQAIAVYAMRDGAPPYEREEAALLWVKVTRKLAP